MNTLEVPYLPRLDALQSADQIINLLEERGTRSLIDCVNWPQVAPYKPLATFNIAHSGTAIYIDFFVRCNYLRAINTENQSPVSQDSCVEFFVEPRPGGEYWNFEFNCIGAVNASHRLVRPEPIRLSDAEIEQISRYPSVGTRPFCELEGLFAWNLMVVIPLSLMDVKFEGKDLEMRGNFYKVASAASQPHYLSWNPIDNPKPDFHRPASFGTIVLKGKE